MKEMKSFVSALVLSACVSGVSGGESDALRGRIAELENETRALREELSATRDKAEKDAKHLADLKLAVAGILDTGEIESPARREESLLLLLNEIASKGSAQALKTIELISLLRKKYEAMPADSPERAAMLLKLDALERDTNALMFLLKPADVRDPENTHVLAVDRPSSIAVLATGSVHGVFPGMVYHVEKSDISLRVIAVRSFVSAAAVENGSVASLNPGMRCSIHEKKLPGRTFFPGK